MLFGLGRAYVVLVVTLLPAVNSDASSVIYQFEPISASPSAGGSSPQVEAVFQDIRPDTVLLTITSSDLGGEFLSDLYFNFDPADNVNQLRFSRLNSTRGQSSPKISTGANAFHADGGYYDVRFDFTKPSKGKFFEDDSITYLIVDAGLNASDFAFVDSTGHCGSRYGTSYALARIQRICGHDEWLDATSLQPIPEPASFSLLASVAGMGWCVCSQSNRINRARRFIKNYFNSSMFS